jgi:hypothetical protein
MMCCQQQDRIQKPPEFQSLPRIPFRMKCSSLSLLLLCPPAAAFVLDTRTKRTFSTNLRATTTEENTTATSRRSFLSTGLTAAAFVGGSMSMGQSAEAIGPVKITLEAVSYTAAPCPPSRPMPGQMAMKGMRGLCVTVQANLKEGSPKDLEKVGVYGYITDGETGDSVLANNPDLSTVSVSLPARPRSDPLPQRYNVSPSCYGRTRVNSP